MSALGGSMIPKIFMPDMLKTIGRFTFNSWAIDGYTKVFWYDQPVSTLGTEVGVLLLSGIVLFVLARIFARRWEAS
jgi:ABC-2 type transport system permease protein